MTPEQKKDLYIEWGLYEPRQQEAIISEYRSKYGCNSSEMEFLEFLVERLEIKGYWAKVGLI